MVPKHFPFAPAIQFSEILAKDYSKLINSRVHIQNAGNIAVILPVHIDKHAFHARSDTVHIFRKSQ